MNFVFAILLSITTLSVFAQESVRRQDRPAGEVITFAGSTCPNGYLLASGTVLERSAYKNLFAAIGTAHGTSSGTNFFLPDYRGMFLRMVDGAKGNDPDKGTRGVMAAGGASGNNVGSVQTDMYASHNHTQAAHSHSTYQSQGAGQGPGSASGGLVGMLNWNLHNGTTSTVTPLINNNGGNETRPKNAYVIYCVKY